MDEYGQPILEALNQIISVLQGGVMGKPSPYAFGPSPRSGPRWQQAQYTPSLMESFLGMAPTVPPGWHSYDAARMRQNSELNRRTEATYAEQNPHLQLLAETFGGMIGQKDAGAFFKSGIGAMAAPYASKALAMTGFPSFVAADQQGALVNSLRQTFGGKYNADKIAEAMNNALYVNPKSLTGAKTPFTPEQLGEIAYLTKTRGGSLGSTEEKIGASIGATAKTVDLIGRLFGRTDINEIFGIRDEMLKGTSSFDEAQKVLLNIKARAELAGEDVNVYASRLLSFQQSPYVKAGLGLMAVNKQLGISSTALRGKFETGTLTPEIVGKQMRAAVRKAQTHYRLSSREAQEWVGMEMESVRMGDWADFDIMEIQEDAKWAAMMKGASRGLQGQIKKGSSIGLQFIAQRMFPELSPEEGLKRAKKLVEDRKLTPRQRDKARDEALEKTRKELEEGGTYNVSAGDKALEELKTKGLETTIQDIAKIFIDALETAIPGFKDFFKDILSAINGTGEKVANAEGNVHELGHGVGV